MKIFPRLAPKDKVEIIAPASRCTDQQLLAMKNLLESWGLDCLVADALFGEDLFCANSDERRYQHLQNALLNPETKAIFCARGGYGSMRLIPGLGSMKKPKKPKLFIGMSDITALQLYLQQQWQWPTIHGASAPDRFSPESIAALRSLLFGEKEQVEFAQLVPLNSAAENNAIISAPLTGGNLCLIQASIGTIWQMDARKKIILLEDVGERGYRIDRMLEHLRQANVFKEAVAIVLGDFLEGKEPDGSSLVQSALKRFAESCEIPVVQVKNVGHGYVNFPIPLGTSAYLQLGREIKLTVLA